MNYGYKNLLNSKESHKNRSIYQINSEEFEENDESIQCLNQILFNINQNNDPILNEQSISKLNEIVHISNESIPFRYFFCQSDIISFLFHQIQLNSVKFSTKKIIIQILYIVIDYYNNEYIEHICELPLIDIIFNLISLCFPQSNEQKDEICSLKLMLSFLSKISCRTIKSRNIILNKFPNSALINPFKQLFEMIKAFSDIESLQSSYIHFFSSLCYFQLDLEITQSIYNEYIVQMFDENVIKTNILWDEVLQIIRYFIYNHFGRTDNNDIIPGVNPFVKIIAQRNITFEILVDSIIKGTQKSMKEALDIMNILIDMNCDVLSYLNFPFLCQNILNPELKVSLGVMHLIHVLISPKANSSNNEEQSTEYYLKFLLKNNLLVQLKSILDDGSLKQKVVASQIIRAIVNRHSKKMVINIIKANFIPPLIDILEINDFNIAKIVVDILYMVTQICSEDEIIALVLRQINENGENKLQELYTSTEDLDDDDLNFTVETILNTIYALKANENINYLNQITQNDNISDDENGATFNQPSCKQCSIQENLFI